MPPSDNDARNLRSFTIRSANMATATQFVLSKARSALNSRTCFLLNFVVAEDQQLDLRLLWLNIQEKLVERNWQDLVYLSYASRESLALKIEGFLHKLTEFSMARIMNIAMEGTKAVEIYTMKEEFEVRRPCDDGDGDEIYVADLAMVNKDGDPVMWYEIADDESYTFVLQKMMVVSSYFRTIEKFILVYYYPQHGLRVQKYTDENIVDHQDFVPLTSINQLEDGRYSTLCRGFTHSAFPVPEPDVRRVDQGFDLVLNTCSKYEGTQINGKPETTRLHSGKVLPLQVTPVDSTTGDSDEALSIDFFSFPKHGQHLEQPPPYARELAWLDKASATALKLPGEPESTDTSE